MRSCCRHVKGSVVIEGLDAYRLARHLGMETADFMSQYTEPFILDDKLWYPIFSLRVKGNEDSCIFLKGTRCTVQEAKPRTCRLYPFWVEPNEPDGTDFRVESRASRDLLQDIADAQAGYIVTHEADRLAEAKRQKSERREKAKQAHIQKMKKLLLEHSLEELKKNDYRNYYRVAKMIQKGVISEEEAAALDKRREEQRSIEQLTII